MASFGRSFKPSFFSTIRQRPGNPRRTLSNSSEMSSTSSSPRSEDPFVMSATNTPISEHPTASAGAAASITSAALKNSTAANASETSNSPGPSLSKPIAIEVPAIRKPSTAPVYTPPAPLSARGDIPGGYFPLHEDPKSRIRRPHPFEAETKTHQPDRRIDRPQSSGMRVDRVADPVLAMSEPSRFPETAVISAPDPRDLRNDTPTPVSSYIPLDIHDSPLPMGKYYPSNYEKRSAAGSQTLRPPVTARPPHAAKSDTQTPQRRPESTYSRLDSDARRRLQQYQRDMVAQATLAASQVLGGSTQLGNSSLAASSSIPEAAQSKGMQLGGSMTRSHKPLSPRLLPLGSPGPVTPIDLEGGVDSYLTRGGPVTAPVTGREQEEAVEQAVLAFRVEERHRRVHGGRSSPLSPVPSH